MRWERTHTMGTQRRGDVAVAPRLRPPLRMMYSIVCICVSYREWLTYTCGAVTSLGLSCCIITPFCASRERSHYVKFHVRLCYFCSSKHSCGAWQNLSYFKTGPRTLPWGTPLVTKQVTILTYWERTVKKAFNLRNQFIVNTVLSWLIT